MVVVAFAVNLDAVRSNVEQREVEVLPSSAQSFCLSIGIYIMSFSGHPCLPSIYRAMKVSKTLLDATLSVLLSRRLL